jgi:hypothetical protein
LSLYFQYLAFSQLQATRAVTGRSVPIIALAVGGAGPFVRYCGPESMGGAGDIGSKIDAEVVRTGLSADEIGSKVNTLHHASGRLNDPAFRRETHSDSWPSWNV